MSSLTVREVEHVANLARLELTEAEIEAARVDLGAVLDYMQELQKLDTLEVEATLGVQPRANVYREDVARPSAPPHEILLNAPDPEAGAFRIPRILEEAS